MLHRPKARFRTIQSFSIVYTYFSNLYNLQNDIARFDTRYAQV